MTDAAETQWEEVEWEEVDGLEAAPAPAPTENVNRIDLNAPAEPSFWDKFKRAGFAVNDVARQKIAQESQARGETEQDFILGILRGGTAEGAPAIARASARHQGLPEPTNFDDAAERSPWAHTAGRVLGGFPMAAALTPAASTVGGVLASGAGGGALGAIQGFLGSDVGRGTVHEWSVDNIGGKALDAIPSAAIGAMGGLAGPILPDLVKGGANLARGAKEMPGKGWDALKRALGGAPDMPAPAQVDDFAAQLARASQVADPPPSNVVQMPQRDPQFDVETKALPFWKRFHMDEYGGSGGRKGSEGFNVGKMSRANSDRMRDEARAKAAAEKLAAMKESPEAKALAEMLGQGSAPRPKAPKAAKPIRERSAADEALKRLQKQGIDPSDSKIFREMEAKDEQILDWKDILDRADGGMNAGVAPPRAPSSEASVARRMQSWDELMGDTAPAALTVDDFASDSTKNVIAGKKSAELKGPVAEQNPWTVREEAPGITDEQFGAFASNVTDQGQLQIDPDLLSVVTKQKEAEAARKAGLMPWDGDSADLAPVFDRKGDSFEALMSGSRDPGTVSGGRTSVPVSRGSDATRIGGPSLREAADNSAQKAQAVTPWDDEAIEAARARGMDKMRQVGGMVGQVGGAIGGWSAGGPIGALGGWAAGKKAGEKAVSTADAVIRKLSYDPAKLKAVADGNGPLAGAARFILQGAEMGETGIKARAFVASMMPQLRELFADDEQAAGY
jgi:hypothetical protein